MTAFDAGGDRPSWGPEPDPILDQLLARAKTLLEAERTAASIEADKSHAAIVDLIKANQNAAMGVLRRSIHSSTDLAQKSAQHAAEIKALRRQLDDIHRSRSWRITAPLRAGRNIILAPLRRIRSAIRRLRLAKDSVLRLLGRLARALVRMSKQP